MYPNFSEMNKTLLLLLFMHCVILESHAFQSSEQLEPGDGIAGKARYSRQAISRTTTNKTIWTDGIVYYHMDVNLPVLMRESFLDAIQFWQNNTCLQFVESNTHKNRIYAVSGKGCSSEIGMQPREQTITLGNGCARTSRHELAHSLGFWHTHMREDRDNYVTILSENFNETWLKNFWLTPAGQADIYGMPYDYGSLMHYGQKGLSMNGKNTIIAKDPSYQGTMGSIVGAFSDIMLMNKLYRCEEKCAKAPPICCKNGGFAHPNNCSTCLCPRIFGGPRCKSPTADACGETFEATDNITSIIRGVEASQGVHPEECTVHIRAPAGRKVELSFRQPQHTYCTDGCKTVGYEVIAHSDHRRRGRLYCCGKFPQTIVSEGELVALIMYGAQKTSFAFSFRAVDVDNAATTHTPDAND